MSSSDIITHTTRSVELWGDQISKAYFELEIDSPTPKQFNGTIQCWESRDFGLSIVQSTPVAYRRRRENCGASTARVLTTIPLQGEIQFSQFGRQTLCGMGNFVLEASDEPYNLVQGSVSKLLVFRADEGALRDRMHNIRRFFATSINSSDGLGRLFFDFLNLSLPHIARNAEQFLPRIGPRLLDTLVMALENDARVMTSSHSAVKEAHLARIHAYIDLHLSNCELSLEKIATTCGISLRYLNQLFKDTGSTGSQCIRDRRLRLARDLLLEPSHALSIANIAYRAGFSDQAQFSKAFRDKFGCSPRDFREQRRE